MKPKLRFKGFEKDWEKDNIKGIGVINPKEELPIEFQYVDLESVLGTELISYRLEHKDSAPSRAQRLAKKGDIFYQTVRPYQKNNYLFDMDEKNFVFSTGYAQIRPNINGSFLFTLLQNDKFVNEVLLSCTGTSYPAINSTDLSNIEILISNNKDEQKAIGEYFRKLDRLIKETGKEIEKLENVKQASLQKMFPQPGESVPQLRFKGFTRPWEEKRLGDLGEFRSNGVDKLSKPDENPINLLNYMDVYNKRIVTSYNCNELMQVTAKKNQIKECNVLKGDIFFTPSSETAADIGHVLVIEEDLPQTCYSYHLMRYRPYENQFYINFPNYAFESNWVRNQLVLAAQGVQRFVLSKGSFEEIIVILPSLAEQKVIGEYFRNLDKRISAKRKKLEKLKQIKTSCLNLMFV